MKWLQKTTITIQYFDKTAFIKDNRKKQQNQTDKNMQINLSVICSLWGNLADKACYNACQFPLRQQFTDKFLYVSVPSFLLSLIQEILGHYCCLSHFHCFYSLLPTFLPPSPHLFLQNCTTQSNFIQTPTEYFQLKGGCVVMFTADLGYIL